MTNQAITATKKPTIMIQEINDNLMGKENQKFVQRCFFDLWSINYKELGSTRREDYGS